MLQRIVPIVGFACAFACAQARPAARVDPVKRVGQCAENQRVSPRSDWEGEIRADYTVDERGSLHDLLFDDFGDGAPEPVLRAIANRLGSCRFDAPGKDAPVKVSQFFYVGTEPDPLGAGMTPLSQPTCATPHPQTPNEAREQRISAVFVVAYVVRSDGTVTRIHPRTPAPPLLFVAVRDWLRSCRFAPVTRNGQPIPVKIFQPFIFRYQ